MFYQNQNIPRFPEVQPSLVDFRGNYYMFAAQEYFNQVQSVQKVTLTSAAASSVKPDKSITYVNRKQFKYILKRREARTKLIVEGRIQPRRLFLHKSRREHALKRIRTEVGTFKSANEDLISEEEKKATVLIPEKEEGTPDEVEKPTLQEHLIRKRANTRGRLPLKQPIFESKFVPKPPDFRSRTVTTAPWGSPLITPREMETKQLKLGEKFYSAKATVFPVRIKSYGNGPADFRSRTVTTAPWGSPLITPRETETKQLKLGEKFLSASATAFPVKSKGDGDGRNTTTRLN